MKDLTKYYIDLKKCTEEQRKHVFSMLPEPEFDNQHRIDRIHFHLSYDENDQWWVYNDIKGQDKTELTYPEFIKLFEEPKKLPSELLKEYFKNTPREQVLKDWESTSDYDNVNSPKVLELFEGGEGVRTELLPDVAYWRHRCLLAEKCLSVSPCDPDITDEQIKAHKDYNQYLETFGNKD